MFLFCSRVMQEPGAVIPENIRSISGANKRRHSSESEPEEEPSSSEEELEEQREEAGASSGGGWSAAGEPEEGAQAALVPQQPAGPSATVPQAAPSKPPCKPAVFVPVDRSPEIQVRIKGAGNEGIPHWVRSLRTRWVVLCPVLVPQGSNVCLASSWYMSELRACLIQQGENWLCLGM